MHTPLAEILRPKTLEDFVGQKHLVGKNAPIRKIIKNKTPVSMVFWGPPGVGKTTLARIIARTTQSDFFAFSAVNTGISDLKKVINQASKEKQLFDKDTLIFIDEIHRFNKGQQDFLLPFIESGEIFFIGATTENPGFSINSQLLSRLQPYLFYPLSEEDLEVLVKRAISVFKNRVFTEDAVSKIVFFANGDGRKAINIVELAASLSKKIDNVIVKKAVQQKGIDYDKNGERHYDTVSAFIKSMRGSDPDATLHYLARMIKAGEDPVFIARRMVIFASEDIGNIQPSALILANACMQAVSKIGMPESELILAQTAIYLATAKKSISVLSALSAAKKDIDNKRIDPIPLHLRNPSNKFMKNLGFGKGHIRYPWKLEKNGKKVRQEYMPNNLKGRVYYKKDW